LNGKSKKIEKTMKNSTPSVIPKYIQIYDWLHSSIRRKRIRVGEMLPPETELADRFGVNRMTVRKALNKLVVEGMIVRERGKGTFLLSDSPRELVYNLEVSTGIYADLQRYGVTPSMELLRSEVIQADEKTAQILSLENDNRVIALEYLFFGNNEPVMYEECYLPYIEFQELLEYDLNQLRYPLMKERYGVVPSQANQSFSAVITTKKQQTLFRSRSPLPCLRLECTMFDATGIPIDHGTYLYRGDRYKFNVQKLKYIYKAPSKKK
jgi:DNA-binding GntR family transcriptional regulator